jgi:hypothetical protein
MPKTVIEELVTLVTLDNSQYVKAEKEQAEAAEKLGSKTETGAAARDKKDTRRTEDRDKRAKRTNSDERRAAQEREARNSKLTDQLKGIGIAAAGVAIGFTTIKGAAEAFGNFVQNTSQLGRSAANLGVDAHEFQTFGKAITLAGGNAEAAKGQFGAVAQSLFAFQTQGAVSPFIMALRTFGVSAIDAKGKAKGLTDILTQLDDAMKARGLNRAQQFQFLQGAGVGEDVANLLLDEKRNEFLSQASAASNVNQDIIDNAKWAQHGWANFKNNLGAIGTTAGNGIINLMRGTVGLDQRGTYSQTAPIDVQKAQASGSPFLPALQAAESKYHIPDSILEAMAYQESKMNPSARNAQSGATGLMQLLPRYHPNAGKDPFADIEDAAQTLSKLHDQFGNWTTAVAAYNDGSGNISKVLAGSKTLPAETQNYLARVVGPTPGANAANGGGTNNTNTVSVGQMTINTQAKDAPAIAEDFSAAMRRKMDTSQANMGVY